MFDLMPVSPGGILRCGDIGLWYMWYMACVGKCCMLGHEAYLNLETQVHFVGVWGF